MHTFTLRCALAAVALLALNACGGPNDVATERPKSPAAASTNGPATTPAATAPPRAATGPGRTKAAPTHKADDLTEVGLWVRIAGGTVEPNALPVYATVGQQVRLEGISDANESLHLHGYDKTVEMKPGIPADLVFTADTKGTFEIETHTNRKLVAKLVVTDAH